MNFIQLKRNLKKRKRKINSCNFIKQLKKKNLTYLCRPGCCNLEESLWYCPHSRCRHIEGRGLYMSCSATETLHRT